MRSHTRRWLRGGTPTGLEQSRGAQAEADVINVGGPKGLGVMAEQCQMGKTDTATSGGPS